MRDHIVMGSFLSIGAGLAPRIAPGRLEQLPVRRSTLHPDRQVSPGAMARGAHAVPPADYTLPYVYPDGVPPIPCVA